MNRVAGRCGSLLFAAVTIAGQTWAQDSDKDAANRFALGAANRHLQSLYLDAASARLRNDCDGYETQRAKLSELGSSPNAVQQSAGIPAGALTMQQLIELSEYAGELRLALNADCPPPATEAADTRQTIGLGGGKIEIGDGSSFRASLIARDFKRLFDDKEVAGGKDRAAAEPSKTPQLLLVVKMPDGTLFVPGGGCYGGQGKVDCPPDTKKVEEALNALDKRIEAAVLSESKKGAASTTKGGAAAKGASQATRSVTQPAGTQAKGISSQSPVQNNALGQQLMEGLIQGGIQYGIGRAMDRGGGQSHSQSAPTATKSGQTMKTQGTTAAKQGASGTPAAPSGGVMFYGVTGPGVR